MNCFGAKSKLKTLGKAETLEQVVIEANRNGFSLEQIQLLTKLTKEQIIEIINKHQK